MKKTETLKVKIEPPTNHATPPKPEKVTTVLSTIVQWIFIVGVIVGCYFLGKAVSIRLPELKLYPYQIILLAFSFGFTWVYIFKWGAVKPFNCCTCMSGWFGFILGYWCYGWMGLAFGPLSMVFAALYAEIRQRYL